MGREVNNGIALADFLQSFSQETGISQESLSKSSVASLLRSVAANADLTSKEQLDWQDIAGLFHSAALARQTDELPAPFRFVGFFKELPHGAADDVSLHESVGLGSAAEKDLICRYLRSGNVLSSTGREARDAFDLTQTSAPELYIATDGVWVWPADLAYYVERYNVCLPEEFTRHARGKEWRVPEFSADELDAVKSRFFTF